MEPNNQNAIFAYAFLGVLLLIAAAVISIVNVANIVAFQLPFIVAISALGTSALALLYAAVKMDGLRS